MYESRAYDKPNTDGFGPDPVVVLVVTGTHDVSRLVHLLSRGLIEHLEVAKRVLRQVKRHNGGRAALELLRAHGGPDFTSTEEDDVDVPELIAEVERLRELVEDYGLDDEYEPEDPDEVALGRSIVDVQLPEFESVAP